MIYKKLFEFKKKEIVLKRDTKAYGHKYATLDQIQKKIGWIFEEFKLLILHRVEDQYVITEIIDLEDDSRVVSKIKMSDVIRAQDKWSEITYFRRYNLLSLLDLEVEDDDWQKASKTNFFWIREMKLLSDSEEPKELIKKMKLEYEFTQERIEKISDFLKDK